MVDHEERAADLRKSRVAVVVCVRPDVLTRRAVYVAASLIVHIVPFNRLGGAMFIRHLAGIESKVVL